MTAVPDCCSPLPHTGGAGAAGRVKTINTASSIPADYPTLPCARSCSQPKAEKELREPSYAPDKIAQICLMGRELSQPAR
jgi:hypothetical protein